MCLLPCLSSLSCIQVAVRSPKSVLGFDPLSTSLIVTFPLRFHSSTDWVNPRRYSRVQLLDTCHLTTNCYHCTLSVSKIEPSSPPLAAPVYTTVCGGLQAGVPALNHHHLATFYFLFSNLRKTTRRVVSVTYTTESFPIWNLNTMTVLIQFYILCCIGTDSFIWNYLIFVPSGSR